MTVCAPGWILLLFAAISCVWPAQGTSQTAERTPVQALRDSIKRYDEEITLLQHFLEASTVDRRALQHADVKSWIISSPMLRDSLFFALMEADSSIQSEAGAEAQVLATASDDIIEIRFGTAVFKGMTLRRALRNSSDPDLYRKVVGSYRYSKDIELRDPDFVLPTENESQLMPYDRLLDKFTPLTLASNPHPVNARVALSLFGAAFKVGPRWGGEIKLGYEEIGFPFWTAGTVAFLATYERFKFGFQLPLRAGRHSSTLFPPFVIKGRKLNGTRGILGEIDLGPFGAFLSVSRLTGNDTEGLTDPNDFAYITGVLQAYYSFGLAFNATNFVRVKVGGGIHRVVEARLEQRPTGMGVGQAIVAADPQRFGSPLIKFEYVNKDVTERFNASLQYYNLTLSLTGAMEILPNLLSLEAKYVWPITADYAKWQNPDFLLISPRLCLTF
jgi:hypothetical protein